MVASQDRPRSLVIKIRDTDQPTMPIRTPTASAAEDAFADQAAHWLMRVSDAAAGAEDHAACLAWRQADPAHERAWRQAVQFWQRDELAVALAAADPGLADEPLRPSRPAAVVANDRGWRAAIAASLFAAVVLGGTLLLPGVGSWLLADRQAPLHRMQQMTLPDGTRITLDAASAVDVSFTPTRRQIVLRSGNVVVDAAPDPQRPLQVETLRATVTVIGTRFLVTQQGGRDRVAVQHGHVAVRNHAGMETQLTPGQQVYTDAAMLGGRETIDPSLVDDFAAGWRSFDHAPLTTVLAEIGRYRWAPILLADTALGELPVTARLQVTEPDRALAALQSTLPIRIQGWPGGLLRLQRDP